jgi:hypothetical protein
MRVGALLALVVGAACLNVTSPEATVYGTGRRILFVGNSLTYENDVPGLVQAMALTRGDSLAIANVTAPNFALIDHWVGGQVQREIARGGWSMIVLQQGPSSTDLNRDSLRLVTKLYADAAKAVNASVGLYAAWPQAQRRQDFARAAESYRLAATDVGGVLFPVSSAWVAAWEKRPDLQLYSDGLHASREGAYLAALVIYTRLTGKSPIGIPASLASRSDPFFSIPIDVARVLQDAAATVTAPGQP